MVRSSADHHHGGNAIDDIDIHIGCDGTFDVTVNQCASLHPGTDKYRRELKRVRAAIDAELGDRADRDDGDRDDGQLAALRDAIVDPAGCEPDGYVTWGALLDITNTAARYRRH